MVAVPEMGEQGVGGNIRDQIFCVKRADRLRRSHLGKSVQRQQRQIFSRRLDLTAAIQQIISDNGSGVSRKCSHFLPVGDRRAAKGNAAFLVQIIMSHAVHRLIGLDAAAKHLFYQRKVLFHSPALEIVQGKFHTHVFPSFYV